MFTEVLTAPVFGPVKAVIWLADKLIAAAEAEFFDEGRVRGQLLQLQARFDMGEITETDYDEQESALLWQLNAIREAKAERRRQ